ncbi:hypothetical protein [Streptomyces sp. NPDC054808]
MLPLVSAVLRIRAVRTFAIGRMSGIKAEAAPRPRSHTWVHAVITWPDGTVREGWLRTGDGHSLDGGEAAAVLDRFHPTQRVVGVGGLPQRRRRLYFDGVALAVLGEGSGLAVAVLRRAALALETAVTSDSAPLYVYSRVAPAVPELVTDKVLPSGSYLKLSLRPLAPVRSLDRSVLAMAWHCETWVVAPIGSL